MNIIDEGIAVTEVKSVSRGGLVISCHDNIGKKKFQEIASVNLSGNYHIKEVDPLRPKIRIGFQRYFSGLITILFKKAKSRFDSAVILL